MKTKRWQVIDIGKYTYTAEKEKFTSDKLLSIIFFEEATTLKSSFSAVSV